MAEDRTKLPPTPPDSPEDVLPEVLPEILPEVFAELVPELEPAPAAAPLVPLSPGLEEFQEAPELEFSAEDLATPAGVDGAILDMGEVPVPAPEPLFPVEAPAYEEPPEVEFAPGELEFSPEAYGTPSPPPLAPDAPPRPASASAPGQPPAPDLVLPDVFELELEPGEGLAPALGGLHLAELDHAETSGGLSRPEDQTPAYEPDPTPSFVPESAPDPSPGLPPELAPELEPFPAFTPEPLPEPLGFAPQPPAGDAPGQGIEPPPAPAAPAASPEPSPAAAAPWTPQPPDPAGADALSAPPVAPTPAPEGLGLPDFPATPVAAGEEPAPEQPDKPLPALSEGWTSAGVPAYPDFVLEWGLGTFLFTGGSVSKTTEVANHPRHLLYLVDYYHSPGPGVLTIDGPPKYAAVLGRKKLQEQGELTEEFTLHIMETHKISDSQTSMAYQLLPSTAHQALMNQSEATRCGYLLYDSTAVAYALALRIKAPAGAAVALHLPSCVVAVAVKGEKIVFARRYILSGDDEGALRFGLSSLHQDVQALKRQGQANPDRIHWVEALVETPVWPKAEYDTPFERLPLSPLDVDGAVQWSALPGVVGRLDRRACLGPRDEIKLLPLERMEKWVWAGLAVLAPALIAGTLMLHGRAGDLMRRADDLRRDNAALRSALQTEAARVAALGGGEFDVSGSRLWAERIRTAGAAPTVAALWDMLAKAKPRGCTVSSLVVNYQGDGVNVRLQGSMDQGVAESQAVFAEFLSRLGQAGFRVNQQALALDGLANAFTIELARSAGN